jgi:hypothetical protein
VRFRGIIILLLATALAGSAADLAGSWKVQFAGPKGTAPKTVGSIVLDLKVDGDVVTGTVHIGPWPGDAPIADGKVDGDRITFTATGSLSSTTGIPTCQFTADVHNGEMILTMTAIRNAGGPLRPGAVYEYRGGKQGD